jgi:hypothetical protein
MYAYGSVLATRAHWRIPDTGSSVIRPVDTVVVPLNAGRTTALLAWQPASAIVHNLIVVWAAIRGI